MQQASIPPNCARCWPRLVLGKDGVCPPGCEAQVEMLYVAEMNDAFGHKLPTSERVRGIRNSGTDAEREGLAKITAGAELITKGKELFCRRS